MDADSVYRGISWNVDASSFLASRTVGENGTSINSCFDALLGLATEDARAPGHASSGR